MSLNTKTKYAWKNCFVKAFPPPKKGSLKVEFFFKTLFIFCDLSQKVKCARYAQSDGFPNSYHILDAYDNIASHQVLCIHYVI